MTVTTSLCRCWFKQMQHMTPRWIAKDPRRLQRERRMTVRLFVTRLPPFLRSCSPGRCSIRHDIYIYCIRTNIGHRFGHQSGPAESSDHNPVGNSSTLICVLCVGHAVTVSNDTAC